MALLGRRLADRATALIATALVAGSWVFLFHGVYGRMYSLFLFLSLLSFVLLLLRASTAAAGGPGRSGASRSCSPSRRIRTARSCSPRRPRSSLAARRDRLRQAVAAFAAVVVVGHPVLAHRPRPRRALRRRRRRRRREARRPVGDRHVPVADGRRLQQRALAGARRRARCSPSIGLVRVAWRGTRARPVRGRRPRGGVPRGSARRLGVARVAPPDLRAPVLRDPRRRPGSCAARGASRPRPSPSPSLLVVLEVELGLGTGRRSSSLGAEQAPGDARPGRALSRRDEPSRRHPVRLRAALPRRLGAQPRLPGRRPPACRRGAGAPHARAARRSHSAAACGSSTRASATTSSPGSRWRTAIPGRPGSSRRASSGRS